MEYSDNEEIEELNDIDNEPGDESGDEIETYNEPAQKTNVKIELKENARRYNSLILKKLKLILFFNKNPNKKLVDNEKIEDYFSRELRSINNELNEVELLNRETVFNENLLELETKFYNLLQNFEESAKNVVSLLKNKKPVNSGFVLNTDVKLIISLKEQIDKLLNPEENDETEELINDKNKNKKTLDNLLERKYTIIMDFNKGKYTLNEFNIYMKDIDKFIENVKTDGIIFDEKLLELETKLEQVLEEYRIKIFHSKHSRNEELKKFENKEYLTVEEQFDFDELKSNLLTKAEMIFIEKIKKELNLLKNEFHNPDESMEPLNSSQLETAWGLLVQKEQEDFIKAINKGKTNLIKFPILSDFDDISQFRKAEDIFYNKYAVFFPSFWSEFIKKEESQIKGVAKKMGLKMPKKKEIEELNDFYSKINRYLPGYKRVMKTTVLGEEYISVNDFDLKSELNDLQQLRKELPIRLTEEDVFHSKKIDLFKKLLKTMDKEKIIDCIMNSDRFKYPNEEIKEKVEALTELIDETREKLTEPRFQEIKKKFEYLERYPDINENVVILPLQRKKAIEKIKKVLPFNGIEPLIEKLEEYVFKIAKGKNYHDKIDDVVLILNYPELKDKFINGNISVYQIALFEKRININGVLKTFITNVYNRKSSINKIINELEKKVLQKSVLNGILIKNKAKFLELYIFDLSQNEKDYFLNLGKLLSYIKTGNIFSINNVQLKNIFVSLQNENDPFIEISTLISQEMAKLETLNGLKKSEQKNKDINEYQELSINKRFVILPLQRKNTIEKLKLKLKLNNLLIEKLEEYIFKISKGKDYNEKVDDIIFILNHHSEIKNKLIYLPVNISVKPTKNESFTEISTLLSQEMEKLETLNKLNLPVSREVVWKPDPNIISPMETNIWNTLSSQLKHALNQNNIENINVKKKELNDYRNELLQKYKNLRLSMPEVLKSNQVDPSIQNEIKKIKSVIKQLTEKYTKLLNPPKKQQNTLISNLRKKIWLKKNPPQTLIGNNYEIDNIVIGELVNAYKRKLIIDKFVEKLPNDKFKLLYLFELYDMNELNNKIKIGGIKKLSTDVYTKIKNYVLNEIRKYSIDYTVLSNKYVWEAINQINLLINGPQIEITTVSNAIQTIMNNWPKTYNGEILRDYYGANIFEILLGFVLYPRSLNTVIAEIDYFKYYPNIKEYDSLVRKFSPKEPELHYQPITEFEGKVYVVHKLDKDWGTGQPITKSIIEMKKNPANNQYLPITKKVEIPGKFSFIKLDLRTSQEGETKNIWVEIPNGRVKYKTLFGKRKVKSIKSKKVKSKSK